MSVLHSTLHLQLRQLADCQGWAGDTAPRFKLCPKSDSINNFWMSHDTKVHMMVFYDSFIANEAGTIISQEQTEII